MEGAIRDDVVAFYPLSAERKNVTICTLCFLEKICLEDTLLFQCWVRLIEVLSKESRVM